MNYIDLFSNISQTCIAGINVTCHDLIAFLSLTDCFVNSLFRISSYNSLFRVGVLMVSLIFSNVENILNIYWHMHFSLENFFAHSKSYTE